MISNWGCRDRLRRPLQVDEQSKLQSKLQSELQSELQRVRPSWYSAWSRPWMWYMINANQECGITL